MGIVFKNNAKTTLASSLSNSATSATVTDGSVFPSLSAGEFFLVTFDDGTNNEICKCTARSGNTLTIVRAQESTTARAFSSGDSAEGRVTAGVLETIQENIAAKSANQTVFNATTAGGATTYNIGTNPGVEANAMVFLNGVLQHHDTLSFSGTNLTFDAAPPNGMALEVIIDNLINLQSSNLTVDSFTAADVGGSPQTDFTLSDTPAAETNLIVFVDGVFQDQDAYTISSNTLTITTGVIAGRGVTVYIINPVNIGTPSDSTVTSAKLSGNITMPGTLTVGSNDVAFDSPTFVVDNANSRVGLGTASPSVPVDIVGDVKMSANLTVDTSTLVVDSSNNRVGIGTSNPAHLLELVRSSTDFGATLEINNTSSANGSVSSVRYVTENETTGLVIGKHSNGFTGGADLAFINQELNSDLAIFTNNTEKMRIDSSGRVLLQHASSIANDSLDNLEVGSGSGNNGMTIFSGSSNYGGIAFADGNTGASDQYPGLLEYYHNDNSMRLYTGSTERMRINDAGNVGIGQNNPQTKLHVTGGFSRVENSGTDAYFFEGVRTGSQTTLRIYDNSNNLYIDSYTNMTFRVNQTGGGSGGTFSFSGSQVGVKGIKQDYIARYTIASGTYTAGTFYEFTNRATIHNLGYGSGIYQFKVYEDSYAMGGGNYFIHYLFEPWYFVNTGSNAGAVMEFTKSPVSMGHATNGNANRIRIRQVEKYGGVPQGFEWSPGGANVTVTGGSGAVYHIDLFKIA